MRIVCGDAFNFGTVGCLSIAGIAGDHAVFIHEVQITILTVALTRWFHAVESFRAVVESLRGSRWRRLRAVQNAKFFQNYE